MQTEYNYWNKIKKESIFKIERSYCVEKKNHTVTIYIFKIERSYCVEKKSHKITQLCMFVLNTVSLIW